MIDWRDHRIQAALLTLWQSGSITRSAARGALIEHLLDAGLLGRTTRAHEYALPNTRRDQFATFLSNIWLQWQETLAALSDAGLPTTAEGLVQLQRGTPLAGTLPPLLHYKTYQARFAMHSKAAATTPPPGSELTNDDVLRLRTPAGFRLTIDDKRIECDALMEIAGEVVLPERALRRLVATDAEPRCLLTVENLGAYVDLPEQDGLLLLHQPGWNSRLALMFIERLSVSIPWYHFGDLDPKGLAIYQSLNAGTRCPQLWIPDFWLDYEETHALPLDKPWTPVSPRLVKHPLVRSLVDQGRWLEQEALVIDPRIKQALTQLVTGLPLNLLEP